jgi:UDP-N-acetylglucosamine--N-acetylmuramyl-(pentapeptide) pyrophosphoryl-undecaprenol N-acetylglucosamine transferase
MRVRLLFAAGGTGGHIFPALAVADKCRELHPDIEIEFAGTRGKLEERVIPRAGYRLNLLWISGLERKLSSMMMLPLKLGRSLAQAVAIMRRLRPQVVICAGAYVSYPIGIAASIRKIPLVLMESNAYPGLVIRRLAPRATEIHVSFGEAAKHFGGRNVFVSGNPIRKAFFGTIDRGEARRQLGLDPDKPTLFAFGGSLGARSINNALDGVAGKLMADGIQIIWQTGTGYSGGERREPGLYRTTFLNEMETGYAAADLVLARAGATTIAELNAVGKPSVLVPLPIETVRQRDNAMAMERAGAAGMILDHELQEKLYATVTGLLSSPERLKAMGDAARSMGILDADERIARHILALAGEDVGQEQQGMPVAKDGVPGDNR